MPDNSIRAVLTVTKALSDAQRVRILMMLRGGELCVCQIVEALGLAPSTVSKHLSILSNADLVQMHKDGRWAYYRLSESQAQPVINWLAASLRDDSMIRQDANTLKMVTSCTPESISQRQRENDHKNRR